MLARKNDKLVHKQTLYIHNQKTTKEFRLKKKYILESFASNESEKKSIMKYYSLNKNASSYNSSVAMSSTQIAIVWKKTESSMRSTNGSS